MYLKELRLKGFKSFARQTSLHFEPGVSVIIGPNGSGKSNLADAVVWALGEQSPTSLRGSSMQDVIFAGSDGRRALASAEVELTLDNSDGSLPLPTAEVSVMRRVTRDGASLYSINHSACRLTDVVELLAPLGLGRELHSIIGQGKVEAFLAGKPEDRRAQIEEAAGLGAYKRRRERGELKLREVRRNLERAALLEREVDAQLAPLRRQATAAQQLAAIEAELGEIHGRLLTGAIAALDDELSGHRDELSRFEDVRLRVEEGLTAVAGARAGEEEAFARRLAERERRSQRLLRARMIDTRLESSQRLTEQRLRLATEMERAAQAESQRLVQELAGSSEEPEGQEWPAVEQRLQAELGEAAQAYAEVSGRVDAAREVQAARRTALGRLTLERESSLAAAARLERRLETLAEEEAHLQTQHQRLAADADETDGAEAAALAKHAAAADALHVAAAAAETTAHEVAAAAGSAEEAEARHRAAVFEARATEDEIDHLRAALHDLQDVDDDVLGVARDYPGTASLAEALSCTPGYERALAAALSQATGALAVPSEVDQWSLLDALRRAGVGLVRLVVATIGLSRPPVFPGSVSLLSKVEVGERKELESALADVVLVDDLRIVPDDFPGLAVTREGAYYRPLAGQLGLAGGVPAAFLLERRAALARLNGRLDDLRRRVAVELDALSMARRRREEAAAANAVASGEERDKRRTADDAERSLTTVRARRRDLATAIERAQRAQESAAAERAETAAAAEAAAATAAEMLFQIERLRPEQEAADGELRAAEDAHAEAQALLTRRRVELEERRGAEQRAVARRAAARERAAAGRARLEELDQRLAELPQARQTCESLLSRITVVRAQAARVVTELEPHLQADAALDRGELGSLAAREAALRQELEEAGERRMAVQVAVTRLEDRRFELTATLEEVSERLERAGFAAPFDEAEEQALREQLERSSRRRERIGPVNPLAAAECSELDERAAFLREQRRDLERSVIDLEQLIKELTARVDAEFAETFAAVREQFVHMVSVLFPGGRGSLELVDPDDEDGVPGVSVQVKPAKKLGQRLQLLSGGERALVAIAFLMALVLARPSPLYILDEIEAALDDVNIGRLVQLLRDYRSRTQFIVITHQKRTMDAADLLYGVTMGPDGASQVVSARMAEAAIERETRSRAAGRQPASSADPG